MRFAITTLGCKANQYDTGTIAQVLIKNGFLQVRPGDGCDVCIINTCAVTSESVRKSHQAIRKLKKHEPDALFAVCGCQTKLDSQSVASIGVDLIGGTDDREEFAKRVIKLVEGETALGRPQNHVGATAPGRPRKQITRTRALLKIQDGCDNYCTYCIIPFTRGASQSMPLGEIEEKAKKLQEEGYKEIVVTGIEISSWQSNNLSVVPRIGTNPTSRHDKKTVTLPLVIALQTISTTAPNARLRLGSLDPQVLTEDFILKLAQIPNLCNHFHISLQSGCDETLKRMGRKYTTKQVLKAIKTLREKFPDCAITADLIVGFPGETDLEFAQTLELIEKAGFSDMHIFPYSQRPGTAAESMPGQVEKSIKQKRVLAAKEIAKQMKSAFLRSQTGKTVTVLFEQQKGKYSIGHSSNYMKVAIHGKIDKNVLRNVKISSIKDGLILGKIV